MTETERYKFVKESEVERVYWDRQDGEYVRTTRTSGEYDTGETILEKNIIPEPQFKDKPKKELVGTIDITPKWMGLFPMFKDWVYNGNQTQKDSVVEHLEILCKSADKVNAAQDKAKEESG